MSVHETDDVPTVRFEDDELDGSYITEILVQNFYKLIEEGDFFLVNDSFVDRSCNKSPF